MPGDMAVGRVVAAVSSQSLKSMVLIGWVWPEWRFKEKNGCEPDYKQYQKMATFQGNIPITGPLLGPQCEDLEKHAAAKITSW